MANTASEQKKDPSLLLECYGTKTFMKIYQALEINKIKFSFVKKGDEKNPIDIYMNAEEFHSDLIVKVNGGQLERKKIEELRRANASGDKNCQSIWESRVGKSSKNTIRKFCIQPGKQTEYVFFATESAENGKSNAKNIVVGCSGKDLILLAFRWSFLYEDYKKVLRERYSIKSMQSPFRTRESDVGQEIPYEDAAESNQKMVSTDSEQKNTDQKGSREVKSYSVGSNDVSAKTQKGQQASNVSTNIPKGKIESFKLKVTTAIKPMQSGKYALVGFTQNNTRHAVVFNPTTLCNSEEANIKWQKFYNRCLNVGSLICFKGIVTEDRIIATFIE